MSKVDCEVEYSIDYNAHSCKHDCVVATCTKCGHQTQSWGHGAASVRRCMAVMNEG